jgi:CrcB protein
MARHGVNHVIHARYGPFPFGIFAVNVAGCLAIGVLAGLLAAERVHIGELGRTFLIVGVLGGFTTFSSVGLDTFTLMRGGHVVLALANVACQVVLGLAAVWAGFTAASWRA